MSCRNGLVPRLNDSISFARVSSPVPALNADDSKFCPQNADRQPLNAPRSSPSPSSHWGHACRGPETSLSAFQPIHIRDDRVRRNAHAHRSSRPTPQQAVAGGTSNLAAHIARNISGVRGPSADSHQRESRGALPVPPRSRARAHHVTLIISSTPAALWSCRNRDSLRAHLSRRASVSGISIRA